LSALTASTDIRIGGAEGGEHRNGGCEDIKGGEGGYVGDEAGEAGEEAGGVGGRTCTAVPTQSHAAHVEGEGGLLPGGVALCEGSECGVGEELKIASEGCVNGGL